jgi:hypothetical protein
MLPATINLSDANSIISNVIGKDDFSAVEITFRFINGNCKKAEEPKNGNGSENSNPSIIFPDEYINQLNKAKTVKHLFFISYQYEKDLKHYSLAEQNRVKQALNNKKSVLQRTGK